MSQMNNRPNLKDVTVCAADSIHPDLAARALEICLSRGDFADAILFSDVQISGSFRWVQVDPMRSREDYSRFCLRELPHRIATPFVLVIQWDGYVVDPGMWTDRFRDCDYIGAPLFSPRDRVGNGGFSLRSRKLLEAVASLPLIPGETEDMIFCVALRETVERAGIAFAPIKLAQRFSYEYRFTGPSFGFHGLYNIWRHADDVGIVEIASGLSSGEVISWQFFGLLQSCLDQNRLEACESLYAAVRRGRDVRQVKALMSRKHIPPALADHSVDRLEALFGRSGAAP